jgi:hypothetical protein
MASCAVERQRVLKRYLCAVGLGQQGLVNAATTSSALMHAAVTLWCFWFA